MKLVITDTNSKVWKRFVDAVLLVGLAISTLLLTYIAFVTLDLILLTLAVWNIIVTIIAVSIMRNFDEWRIP